ncbi:hypothetical protein M427DRAFT_56468 [Gonapodya prolifera JEL478]|uniref:F-box domain-containing protein n=1 Tax=Gonapodya prolifera (strain JEL478) TaxID=1344416 RepID=A0A139AHL6_GONPJ|nr:hypothetical protein M427DRAFT_56468 [Gonapodya prolifera JEL478]|eukprot:KXS15903.1 hypothetical protein M427DRAFT_56468 [Gonapodya prolifera JEL478]
MRAFSFGVCSLFDSTSLEILTSTCPHLTSLTLDRVGRIPAADLTNTVGRLLFLEDLRIELMIGLRPVEMAHAKALVDHPRLMSLRYSEYDLAGEDVRDVLFQRFTGK